MALSRMCIVVLDDPSREALERAIAQAGGSPQQLDLVGDDNYYVLVSRERKIGWYLGWLRMRMMMDRYSREHADRLVHGIIERKGRPVPFDDVFREQHLVWASSHELLFPLSPPGRDYDFDFIYGMMDLLFRREVIVLGGLDFRWAELVDKAPWLMGIDIKSCVDIVDRLASLSFPVSKGSILSRYDRNKDLFILTDCRTGRKIRISLSDPFSYPCTAPPGFPEFVDMDIFGCGRHNCPDCNGLSPLYTGTIKMIIDGIAQRGTVEVFLSGCDPCLWPHRCLDALSTISVGPGVVLGVMTECPEVLLDNPLWMDAVHYFGVMLSVPEVSPKQTSRVMRISSLLCRYNTNMTRRLDIHMPLDETFFSYERHVLDAVNLLYCPKNLVLHATSNSLSGDEHRLKWLAGFSSKCQAEIVLDRELSRLWEHSGNDVNPGKITFYPLGEDGSSRCYMRIRSPKHNHLEVNVAPSRSSRAELSESVCSTVVKMSDISDAIARMMERRDKR